MNPRWELMISGQVLEFTDNLTKRERIGIMAEFERLTAHPVLGPDDFPRIDGRGRTHHVRFAGGYGIKFWFDHGEKVVNVMEVGWQ